MVGQNSPKRSYSLEQVLTDTHIRQILEQAIDADTKYEIICSEVRPAAEGLTGFLGDHIRIVLHAKLRDEVRKVHLFVKRVPIDNKPKADFIDMNNYFRREALMLRLIDELKGAEGPNPWGARAYVSTESLIVMPDLGAAGYSVHPLLEALDLRHVLLAAASLARYHAAFANLETRMILDSPTPCSFYDKHKHLLAEPTFTDTPWVRTTAKMTADILDTFSQKYTKRSVPDLEEKLARSFVDACQSLDVAEGDLNVMLHKDLWNNNIMFRYEEGVPTNAVLIDYQCVRYGPPAFDIMSFLYLTTSRMFREEREGKVLKYYFKVFSDSLEDPTRKRLDAIGYDEKEFLLWCEKSRMFGIFEAAALFPQVLMDARSAERVFDDPDTFLSVAELDRSPPVLHYARDHPAYTRRTLEVSDEFVERFLVGLR